MLGTNDILHTENYKELRDNMQSGFLELARQLKNMPSRPLLYVMIPSPIISGRGKPKDEYGEYASTHWLPQQLKEFAAQIPIPSDHVIDLHEVITPDNVEDLLNDFVHPNTKGHQLIAQKVYETLFVDEQHKAEIVPSIYRIGQI